MNKLMLIFFLAIVLISCKEKENSTSKKTLNPIEYSMDNNANLVLENSEINSSSIGVYNDGKTYGKYYGEIDKGKGNIPNEKSLFKITSVTKTFTKSYWDDF